VVGLVHLLLGRLVTFLRDQIVNAFVVFHLNQL
jgi:hypothetical protein